MTTRQGRVAERSWPIYALLGVVLLLAHGLVLRFLVPGVVEGSLIDPDSYTRLVRVTELAGTGNWFDHTIDRMNGPFGLELHWTRPLDVILLAGAWLLTPFLGFEAGLYWFGALVSPALHIAACLGLAWAVTPYFTVGRRPLVVVVFLMQPLALNYAYAGRADHHMLLVLSYVMALGFFARAFSGSCESRWSLLGGLVGGLGLWTSVEFLLPLATLYLPLAVAWMVGLEDASRKGLLFSIGLFAVVALGVALESGPSGFLVPEYDRLSIAHLGLIGMAVAPWIAVRGIEARERTPMALLPRILLLTALGVASLIPVLALFPGITASPMSNLDPRFETLLMQQIVELQPVFPRDRSEVGSAVARLGHAIFALPFLLSRLSPRLEARTRILWLPPILAFLVFVPLGLHQIRYAVWTAVPIAIGVTGLLAVGLERTTGAGFAGALARASFTAGVLLAPLFVGGALLQVWGDRSPPPPRAGEAGCSVPRLATELSEGSHAEATYLIVAHPDIGPELVYRTHHSVVAAPYHRNVNGVLDAHDILAATVDAEARALVDRRGIDVLIVCPEGDAWFGQGVADGRRTLFARLLDGQAPAWLDPDAATEAAPSGFLVYRVRDP